MLRLRKPNFVRPVILCAVKSFEIGLGGLFILDKMMKFPHLPKLGGCGNFAFANSLFSIPLKCYTMTLVGKFSEKED